MREESTGFPEHSVRRARQDVSRQGRPLGDSRPVCSRSSTKPEEVTPTPPPGTAPETTRTPVRPTSASGGLLFCCNGLSASRCSRTGSRCIASRHVIPLRGIDAARASRVEGWCRAAILGGCRGGLHAAATSHLERRPARHGLSPAAPGGRGRDPVCQRGLGRRAQHRKGNLQRAVRHVPTFRFPTTRRPALIQSRYETVWARQRLHQVMVLPSQGMFPAAANRRHRRAAGWQATGRWTSR